MVERIGKYRILDRLGRGGMGTVYRAHDPTLDRLVAIKVISSGIEITDEQKSRFYREAQACARLNHPNIITVHELGEDGGQLFIVMELLHGEDLRHVIARRPVLPLEEKLAWMVQLCDGLHYAHQKEIVHRDVKPGNIFIGSGGQVKILDFGLARIVGAESSLTQTGLIMGTLRYMSPEQVRGRVDHRSDIFSVGTVFYELLSYRSAFDGDDPMEVLEMLRTEDPPSLSAIDPTLPAELSTIIERAMRKRPAERFADLGQMREQLDALVRRRSEQADVLREQVERQLGQVQELRAALAERIGEVPEDEVRSGPDDRVGLAKLQVAHRELAAQIERLRGRVSRAEGLEAALLRASTRLAAGDPVGAVPELERILQMMPEHRRARDQLTALRERLSTTAAELAAALGPRVDEALNRAARSRAAQLALSEGRGRLATGDASGAIERFSAALAFDPTDSEASLALAEARAQLAARERRETEVSQHLAAAEQALASQDAQAAAAALARIEELAPDQPQLPSLRLRARRLQDGEPLSSSRTPTGAAWLRRTRLVVGVAMGLAVLAAALLLWRTVLSPRPESGAQAARSAMLAARASALAADPERLLLALWVAAMDREIEAETALTRNDVARARALYRDAQQRYERVASEAQKTAALAAQEAQARRAEAGMVEARGAAEAAEAPRLASRPWAAALDRQREAESALRRQDFARAQALWAEAEKAYRDASVDARRAQAALVAAERERAEIRQRERQAAEQGRDQTAQARARADGAGAAVYAPKLLAQARAKDQEGQAALERRDYAAAQARFQEAREDYGNAAQAAQREALVAQRERTEAEQAQARLEPVRSQADQANAPRFASRRWAEAVAREAEGRLAFGRADYPRAAQLFRDATQEFQQAGQEAQRLAEVERQRVSGLERQRFDAEQSREQVLRARRGAEQAAAERHAARLVAAAQEKEREAVLAFGQQDFPRAQQLFRESRQEYERATAEAQRLAALERQRQQQQDLDRARGAATAGREAATKAEADRLTRELFDRARAREAEAEALVARQGLVAATQVFHDAAQQYGEAARRVELVRQARADADQARARMQADKRRARADAADYREGAAEEERGNADYERLAFREAVGRYQSAQAMFARAVAPPAPPTPAAPAVDPRTEIRTVLEAYKRAMEAKDLALLQRVRPGLSAAELQRIRASFDAAASHRLDLAVQSIEVEGDAAEVRGRRTDEFASREGQRLRNEGTFVFRMRRTASGWVIETVR